MSTKIREMAQGLFICSACDVFVAGVREYESGTPEHQKPRFEPGSRYWKSVGGCRHADFEEVYCSPQCSLKRWKIHHPEMAIR